MNIHQTITTENEENPKLVRFDSYMLKLNQQCEEYLSKQDISGFIPQNFEDISRDIDSSMIHDTYESLTIEGYDVSKENINIIVNGLEKKYPQKISSKIDIEGYLDSYKVISGRIKSEYGKSLPIDDDLFFDINLTLFSYYPIAKKYDIPRAYRKENIRISGTSYLPPSHVLVNEYMKRFISFMNNLNISDSKDIMRSAILSHFFFVHIHPFGDGNGRTGRLLMNYIFGINKHKGITISHKEREAYIVGLKEASENDNIIPFVEFILKLLK